MRHYKEGQIDTWICGNPKCGNFDYRLSLSCPACDTSRVRTANDLFVCLNPECPTYAGDIVHDKDLEALKRDEGAKAAELAGADAEHHRAKKGQGTAAAAKRRRESRTKSEADETPSIFDEPAGPAAETDEGHALPAGKGMAGIQTRFLGEVKRTEETVKYELWRHKRTGLTYRRREVMGKDDDPLFAKTIDGDPKLTDAERLAKVAASIMRKAKTVERAQGAAKAILEALDKEGATEEVEVDVQEVEYVIWRHDSYQVKEKKESWLKGKERLGKQLGWRPKKIKLDTEAKIKAKRSEANGKLRMSTQNKMRKDRDFLASGEDFEISYTALFSKRKYEIWPNDDDDPKDGVQAPLAEWQRSAYPDIAQA